jgi:hypothetical protein
LVEEYEEKLSVKSLEDRLVEAEVTRAAIQKVKDLQSIVTAVEKCFADDPTGAEVALDERVTKRLEELNAKIAILEAEAKKPEPMVAEKELQSFRP